MYFYPHSGLRYDVPTMHEKPEPTSNSSKQPSEHAAHQPNDSSNTSGVVGGDPVADRRVKLQRMRSELGIDPFGGRVDGLVSLEQAREQFNPAADAAYKALGKEATPDKDTRPAAFVSGRIVLHRDIGKLIFMTLRDHSGDLQIAVSKNSVDEATFKLAKLVDLGDLVTASGRLGTTKTGEITLWVQAVTLPPLPSGEGRGEGGSAIRNSQSEIRNAFSMAGKALLPPPEKWHGLSDPELRYRQRYVDLWTNPQVMRTMKLRIRIVSEIRQYLTARGFLEVETPMLQPIHGGAAARPFITHHNALDMRLFLRIAPELYLKRLLVGGFDKVFEINRNFRNEGISPRHNPEFTMLEAYQAFGSWQTMADLVEDMICTVAMNVFGDLAIHHRDTETQSQNEGAIRKTINLKRPWRRVRLVDLVEERTGWKFNKEPLTSGQIQTLREQNPGKDLKLAGSPAEQLVEVYEKLIEPTLIDPTFVTHVPSVIIPLARENKDDPFFADVYELAINGQEISPGYSELNDPDVQERHLRHQVGDREEQQQIDEDFLNALRVGMPPAGGMGLGIDRLVTMLTGEASLRDVILFPLLRQKQTDLFAKMT